MIRRPYRDDEGRIMFVGQGWFLLLAIPWVVGIVTILRWLLT